MTWLLTGAKLLGTALSFMGLCGLIRHRTKLDGTAAPLVAACAVIVLLMLGGMIGALAWTWRLLFAAGLAGFVWRYAVRRDRPCLTALVVTAAFAAYGLVWLRGAAYTGNDSVSHWGMVVKCLMRLDRFPDDASQLIYFRSYPMGSGVFIYYMARLPGESEGYYMAAQLMLNVFGCLPMFGLIRRNRAFGWPLALGATLYLLVFNTGLTTLQVDAMLPMIAAGGLAIVVMHADRPRRMLAGVLPVIAALMFIKQSGGAFAALLIAAAVTAGRRGAAKLPRGRALALGAVCVAAMAAAFGSWQLYARLTYADLSSAKHAVSLSRFAQIAGAKDAGLVRDVAVGLLRRIVQPARAYRVPLLLAAVSLGGSALLIRLRAKDRALWLHRLWRTALACVGAYLLWLVMLFFMYLLSMPAEEARELASIERYERSGIGVVIAAVVIFMLRCFCAEDFDFGRAGLPAAAAALTAAWMLLCFGTGSLSGVPWSRLTSRPSTVPRLYPQLAGIAASGQVEEGKSYFVFTMHDQLPLHTAIYATKYLFFSNDIMAVAGNIIHADFDPGLYYSFRNTYGTQSDIEVVDDLKAVLDAYAADYDYILVCARDDAFEAALSTWDGDTPVIRGY